MAEVFNNYLVSKQFSSQNESVTIVPIAGGKINDTIGRGSRYGAQSQIHSIYLTKRNQDSYSTNPENDGVDLSVSIYDTANNKEYFIARYIKVLPNSSFYIEKTITLTAQDCIRLTYHGSTSTTIDAVCSGVDLT